MSARRRRSAVQRRRDLVERSLQFQRWLIVAIVGLAPLVFWRATLDIFGIVKAALVVVGALLVGAVALARVFRSGRLDLPKHPLLWPLAAFFVLATITTFTSYTPMQSFVGHYSRFSGLLMYVAFGWLLLATLRAFDEGDIGLLAGGLLAGAGLMALYGVFQELGIDPIPWGRHVGVTSTLGNPNYVAAHAGIAIPIAAWGALERRWHLAARVASGVALLLLVWVLPLAGSTQGYLAAGIGLGVIAIAWVRGREGLFRRVALGAWGAGAAAGLALVAITVAGAGPFTRVTQTNSFQMRLHDMGAAVNMTLEYPFLGVGFDRFGGYYHAHRAAEATELQSLRATTSVPHSVHLDMFASGGFPLGLAYLAVVGAVSFFAVRALVRREGSGLLALGGLAGAWFAYQAAALVSIDVPSLGVTGWVLAAAVLVVARPAQWTSWTLPWARTPDGLNDKQARRATAKTADLTRRVGTAVSTAVALFAAVGLWLIYQPVKADVHAKDAEILSTSSPEQAVAASRQAQEKVWWEPKYPMQTGSILVDMERYEQALAAFRDAADRDPRDLGAVLSAARLAETVDRMDLAADLYDQSVELEPNDPTLLSDVARFLIKREEFERALVLLEIAVERRPEQADYWLNLGYARQETGATEAAIAAYERTLELKPNNNRAKQLLQRLRDA